MNSNTGFRWLAMLPAFLLVACSSQRPAPVVDRSGRGASTAQAPAVNAPPSVREARDGMYTVQRGDTLPSVALSFRVDPRDLARWNDIADSSPLRPGQSLRVIPPVDVATVTPITGSGQAEVRPLPLPGATGPVTPTPLPPGLPPAASPVPSTVPSEAAPAVVPPAAVTPPAATPPATTRPPSSTLPWQWPTAGKVVETFDDPRNKGIDIAGVEGAAVIAAADGEVVYVGSAVRGYGNLVIVRHSDEFITAYAHNRKVLVAEKQAVKRGQTIAELGRSDADRPKLHFEIRHQGKPVDPLKYLPAR
ncbi:MAG: peptidoglycan DD-metalloendopeptidase family protein [Burkholderiaceae bacterium]|nr:peptidoglycan DD-metalloendopeptidase family protein [Burkholderiaceae bacterium]